MTRDDQPGQRRIVDEELLRYLARKLGELQEVSGTSLFPANKQETLIVSFSGEYYPASLKAVRLELRVYTSGDFHISYIEKYLGERRRCRWDRHDQDHSSRDHFHPLPDASTTEAEDRDFPDDVTELLHTNVLPWVESRLGTLWEETPEG